MKKFKTLVRARPAGPQAEPQNVVQSDEDAPLKGD